MANVGSAILVVAAALIDGAGDVLVQRRPVGGSHAGLWEFPGGKVEPGEAAPDALVRELREELGIAVTVAAFVPVTCASAAAGERPIVLLLYACRTWQGEPMPLAADALQWRAPATLAGLAMPPLDRPLVIALAASLASAPEG